MVQADSEYGLFSQLLAALLLIAAISLYLLFPKAKQEDLWLPNENTFVDPNDSNKRKQFPSLFDPPSLELSVIIPAYNEENRLPVMLEDTLKFLNSKRDQSKNGFDFELLIVDDGSQDATSQVALQSSKLQTTERVRVLTLQKNRGKGGAVKRGMMCARGKILLFADADGATNIIDLDRLITRLDSATSGGLAVAAGSRAHLAEDVVAKRAFIRNVLMWGFHILVSILGVRGIKDTQCGFKLFSRKAAQLLFPNQHIERWAFDVELLYLAQQMRIPIVEVPVNWREVPGSKLGPVEASISMARDLVRIRLAYILGIWRYST